MPKKLAVSAAALILTIACTACASSREPEFPLGKSHVTLAPGVTVVRRAMDTAKTTSIKDLGYREISEAEFLDRRFARTGKGAPPSLSDVSYVFREYTFVADIGDGIRVKASVPARMLRIQMGNYTEYVFDEVYEDMTELAPASKGAYAVHKTYAKAVLESPTSLAFAVGGYAEEAGPDGTMKDHRQFSALQRWNSNA